MKDAKITRDDITFNPPVFDNLIFPNSNVCSVVAVAQALDISFDEAYERLSHEGKRCCRIMNSSYAIYEVLKKRYNWVRSTQLTGYLGISELEQSHQLNVFDVITKMYTMHERISKQGFLMLDKQHIFYTKNLTIYDGVTSISGKLVKPSDNKKDEILSEKALDLYVPKKAGERCYENARVELFMEVILYGNIHALFTESYLDMCSIPKGFKYYEIRHDPQGFPNQIGNHIFADRLGCILSLEEICLDENGFRDIAVEGNKNDWIEISGGVPLLLFKYNQKRHKN